jgi:hypothetical protein
VIDAQVDSAAQHADRFRGCPRRTCRKSFAARESHCSESNSAHLLARKIPGSANLRSFPFHCLGRVRT